MFEADTLPEPSIQNNRVDLRLACVITWCSLEAMLFRGAHRLNLTLGPTYQSLFCSLAQHSWLNLFLIEFSPINRRQTLSKVISQGHVSLWGFRQRIIRFYFFESQAHFKMDTLKKLTVNNEDLEVNSFLENSSTNTSKNELCFWSVIINKQIEKGWAFTPNSFFFNVCVWKHHHREKWIYSRVQFFIYFLRHSPVKPSR